MAILDSCARVNVGLCNEWYLKMLDSNSEQLCRVNVARPTYVRLYKAVAHACGVKSCGACYEGVCKYRKQLAHTYSFHSCLSSLILSFHPDPNSGVNSSWVSCQLCWFLSPSSNFACFSSCSICLWISSSVWWYSNVYSSVVFGSLSKFQSMYKIGRTLEAFHL